MMVMSSIPRDKPETCIKWTRTCPNKHHKEKEAETSDNYVLSDCLDITDRAHKDRRVSELHVFLFMWW